MMSESTLESPPGQQREEIPALPPVLKTQTDANMTASSNTVYMKLLSVFSVRISLGCKHKGENVIIY